MNHYHYVWKDELIDKLDKMAVLNVLEMLPRYKIINDKSIETTIYRRSSKFNVICEYLKTKGIEVKIYHLVGTHV